MKARDEDRIETGDIFFGFCAGVTLVCAAMVFSGYINHADRMESELAKCEMTVQPGYYCEPSYQTKVKRIKHEEEK